ncbi:MAG: hypothetical protein HFI17_08430 [Lachnospiraceae bacterium]|jgi:hypothetical protein|nr:hypothetical protein [Lachnospiraceae bacterium]
MMSIRDAEKVIDRLSKKPFICSENYIKTDNGYVIVKKEYFEKYQDIVRAMREIRS